MFPFTAPSSVTLKFAQSCTLSLIPLICKVGVLILLFFSHIQLRGVGKAFKVVEHEEMLIFVSLCEWLVHYDPVDRMSVGYMFCKYLVPVCGFIKNFLNRIFHKAEVFSFNEIQLSNVFFHISCCW